MTVRIPKSIYGDLTKLKSACLLNDPAGSNAYDTCLFDLLAAVSSWVEGYTDRHFYVKTETKTLDGTGTPRLLIPDLIAITTFTHDEAKDLTFNTTLLTTDYWLYPLNANPQTHVGQPYTSITARPEGAHQQFTEGPANYKIIGTWGWSDHNVDSGGVLAEGAELTAADLTITVDDGTLFAIGQTILLDTEQLLITGIATDDLTVVRALNGTTAATHDDAISVYIQQAPAAVEQATLMTAARIFTRSPAFEPFYVDTGVDTDVELLLAPYRKVQA